LTETNCGKHLFVVSARKLSNETPSKYIDADPSFIETIDENGKPLDEYRWSSGHLHPLGTLKIVPDGAHVLTVRDFERSVLAGATIAENIVDDIAISYENTSDVYDDRERSDDNIPRRSVSSLSEQEQLLHTWLCNAELYDLADLLRIDFDNLPRNHPDEGIVEQCDEDNNPISCIESQATATILNDLQPTTSNPKWVEFVEYIELTIRNPKQAWKIIQTLTILLREMEAVASLPPGDNGFS